MSDDNELSLDDLIDQAELRAAKDQAAANAVASRAADIKIFAEQNGVSADAVAAALYEEARDEAGEGFEGKFKDTVAATLDLMENHDSIAANVEQVLEDQAADRIPPRSDRDALTRYKIFNVASRDLGVANLNVATSVRLLRKYIDEHPDSDPLGLKKYQDDYPALLRDLRKPKSSTTVKVITLSVQEAEEFFEENRSLMPEGYWESLTDSQKNSLYVAFHNLGRAKIEKARDERLENGLPYRPGIDENGDFIGGSNAK